MLSQLYIAVEFVHTAAMFDRYENNKKKKKQWWDFECELLFPCSFIWTVLDNTRFNDFVW